MYLTPQSGVYIWEDVKMGFTFINKLPTPAEIGSNSRWPQSWQKSNTHGTREIKKGIYR